MHDFLVWRFQFEISRQCRFAFEAFEQLHLDNEEENPRFWFALHAFLSFTANVSKLLWGTDEKTAKRRRPLRNSLGINESSILKDRTLRNHLDHIDERLESWFSSLEESDFEIGGDDMSIDDEVDDRGTSLR